MKRIWIRALGAAVLCAALLAGCSRVGGSASSVSAAADPLTGQELLYPDERVTAVTIDNAVSNTAQWGIGSASVVLEAATEAQSATSLCLVYPSLSAMPTVGPVALGQELYDRVLSGQQVLPVQCGSGLYTRNYLDYYGIRAVDALEVGRNAFYCEDTWSNVPLWKTDGSRVSGVLNSLNVDTAIVSEDAASEAETTLPALLPQKAGARRPEADAVDAAAVQVHFQQSVTGFTYDAQQNVYQMQHGDGTPQLDANTGTQAAFDNLLILYTASDLREDGRTLDYDLTMGGGVWLYGGQLWNITWTQGSASTFALYDADGRPLSIEPGHTYIAFVSSVTGQELVVTSSAGETLTGGEYLPG